MDLTRMLEKCEQGQWNVADLDFGVTPRPMTRNEEITVVQYFTDMAGIELLAGALFAEQAKRARDPLIKRIFETFVVDEERHSEAAARLARHYDVHRYQAYKPNAALVAFKPHFVHAVKYLSPEVANYYITGGELILDVALLRSLNDYVHDEMSQRAMDLINRDESRHIAMDFYMTQHYAHAAKQGKLEVPKLSLRERGEALWAFANVLYFGKPFFDDVFFGPMKTVDPTGARLREAYRRIQLLQDREEVRDRPFMRFVNTWRKIYDHPVLRKLFGAIALRISGIDASVLGTVYSEADYLRAKGLSFEQLADEAVAAKYTS